MENQTAERRAKVQTARRPKRFYPLILGSALRLERAQVLPADQTRVIFLWCVHLGHRSRTEEESGSFCDRNPFTHRSPAGPRRHQSPLTKHQTDGAIVLTSSEIQFWYGLVRTRSVGSLQHRYTNLAIQCHANKLYCPSHNHACILTLIQRTCEPGRAWRACEHKRENREGEVDIPLAILIRPGRQTPPECTSKAV